MHSRRRIDYIFLYSRVLLAEINYLYTMCYIPIRACIYLPKSLMTESILVLFRK